MEDFIISNVEVTINGDIEVKLKEDNKYHKIMFGFVDSINKSSENIGISIKVGNGKNSRFILFSKDSYKNEFHYILEKMLNYDIVSRFVKNLIIDYFNSQDIGVISQEINKD